MKGSKSELRAIIADRRSVQTKHEIVVLQLGIPQSVLPSERPLHLWYLMIIRLRCEPLCAWVSLMPSKRFLVSLASLHVQMRQMASLA
jgi:hypothetical protein